jgi:hypothetical protein
MPRSPRARTIACLSLVALAPWLIGATELRFQDGILSAHNHERFAMKVAPLRWNEDLAAKSQVWADHLARTGRFEHSPNAPNERVGENIWGGTRERFAPERMVERWIAEKEHFTPGVFPGNSRTGDVRDVSHYTQVIWKSTTDVGCAIAQSEREDILVCRYSGAGNVYGTSPV